MYFADSEIIMKKPKILTLIGCRPKSFRIGYLIAVPAQNFWGGNEVLPNSCDVCQNHNFLILYG